MVGQLQKVNVYPSLANSGGPSDVCIDTVEAEQMRAPVVGRPLGVRFRRVRTSATGRQLEKPRYAAAVVDRQATRADGAAPAWRGLGD